MPDGAAVSTDEVQQEDGMISVVLSPVQLAAVLERASITENETVGNRIWGAVGMVGGALELLGSAALLVDPDPTVSKIIGAVGLVHGTDVYMTSWEQLRTGRPRATMTAQVATGLASELGLGPEAAGIAGAVVDIMVPTAVAAGVARSQRLFRLTRIAVVSRGFVSLQEEEQLFNFPGKPKASAHTLRDHVGKTLSEMLNRFKAKPSLEATASFRTVQEAEQSVSEVLQANKSVIRQWCQTASSKPLRLTMRLARDVGDGVLNPANNAVTPGATYVASRIRTVTVVLAKTNLNGRTWYVLTAFPDIMRDLGLIN